jgi:hypothetical protein
VNKCLPQYRLDGLTVVAVRLSDHNKMNQEILEEQIMRKKKTKQKNTRTPSKLNIAIYVPFQT